MRVGTVRRGFTLPEVLVTIAIVATLAAVLLPALTSQISKGDATRVAEDLLAIQTATSTFTSDIKRYPSSLAHLTDAITGQSDINGDPYPTASVGKWKGPYLAKDVISPGDSLRTGFGGTATGLIKRTYNSIPYVTVVVKNLSTADFNRVDELLDETANSTTGQFVLSGTDAHFFAVPVQ